MSTKFITSDKILYYPERLSLWQQGLKDKRVMARITPVTVEIHPSNVCDQKCYYCFAEKQKDGRLIKTTDALHIISKLSRMGVLGLIFSGGGEPVLHPDLDKMILHANKCKMEIGLITNGASLSPSLVRVIIKNCAWVKISLDTTNPHHYQVIRGVNALGKVIENMKALVGEKRKTSSKCTIGAQTVVTEENYRDFCTTTSTLNKIGVDYFQIRPLENKFYTKRFYDCIMRNMHAAPACAHINLIISEKWKIIDPNSDLEDRGYDGCWCYPFIGAITVDGNMYICCHFVGVKKLCYGNVIYDSIQKILHQREKIASLIDLKKCPLACRGNQINIRLEGLKRSAEHAAFL